MTCDSQQIRGGLQIFGLAACLFLTSVSPANDTAATSIAPDQREFFEKEVRPLLVKRCFECHDGKITKGGLSLASAHGWQTGGDSGPAILPRKPDDSLLIRSIRYTDEDYEMPPPKIGKLPAEEIAILTKWVAMGAPDPRSGTEVLGGMTLDEAETWWAFQPLPEPPSADPAADVAHIDELLQHEIERNGLKTAPAADRRTLLRRLSYGLTGLPPSAAEVETFLADASPDAFAKQIERLLDSPQYGVQWGRRWLDVVRYADSAGDNSDRPLPHAWRYRNWVMDAFQRDLPYDEFVRLQLAGDLITAEADPQQRAEGIVATGYLALARRFGFDSDKDMFLTYEDTIDNLGKSFLGLTLACARCHDHKYDPVSAEDYYALYGILESSRFSFAGCEKNGQPRDLVPLVPQSEIDAMKRLVEEQQAQSEIAKRQQIEAAQSVGAALAKVGQGGSRVIASSLVTEGGSVLFEQTLRVRKGEVLQLTVSPNEKHGADTTLVEWTIAETGGAKRSWSTADLVPDLIKGNPLRARDGAQWCFLETFPAPVFLADAEHNRDGNAALKSWGNGSTPVIVVNTADQQVMAWTTLAPESFFMHPGHQRPVAVAWVSPLDGELTLSGRVADVHPSQGDGVAFELTHIAVPDYGPALVQLGGTETPVAEPEPMPVIPVAYAVVDREAPKNAHFQERGEPENPGPEVPRRWLTVFGGEQVPPETGSGRRELGDWIASHPLTARVMVNRIWQWHFGHGLVRSPNDFGARGEPPTHPELLDFLAARFVQSGYSVKAMHRLILQTAAYQRSSFPADSGRPADSSLNPSGPVKNQSEDLPRPSHQDSRRQSADLPESAGDPNNLWLAHFSRRRLTAEELRDSVLLASGRLDLTPGTTHPFPEESTWKFSQHRPFNDVYETDKRSAFLMVQRQRRHPYLALFDGADPNASTPARETSTVPTQALYFINDPVFHAQAAAVAEKLLNLPDDETRIAEAWSVLFQRKPTADESERARNFLAAYPDEPAGKWAAKVRVLMASNEFLHVD